MAIRSLQRPVLVQILAAATATIAVYACSGSTSFTGTSTATPNPSGAAAPPEGGNSATPASAPTTTGGAGRAAGAPPIAGTSGSPGGAGAPSAAPVAGMAALDDAGTTPPNTSDAATAAPSELPAVTDFEKAGPFTPMRGMGPSGYVTFYAQELGKNGVKHPIISWGPGAAENAGIFSMLLNHLASHGFAVISYDATPQGKELTTAIDWMLSENERAGSVFYQKLDPTKIAAGGHSAGSLATFVVAADKRLITTMHISGGTFDPHTDIKNLHAPALFVCGEPGGDGLLMGDVANPNCDIDFMNATVPVFYGITKGAAHMTPTDIGDATIRAHQFGAMVGWLRWQLAGDANAKNLFVGATCTLCKDAAWSSIKQKDLN